MQNIGNASSHSHIVSHLKNIERHAYPEQFWMMQDCETIEDIADYCECDLNSLIVLHDSYWYALIANGRCAEFVDIAKDMRVKKNVPWSVIISTLHDLKINKIYAELRELTSYRLVCRLVDKHNAIILTDDRYYDYDWCEYMHAVLLHI